MSAHLLLVTIPQHVMMRSMVTTAHALRDSMGNIAKLVGFNTKLCEINDMSLLFT